MTPKVACLAGEEIHRQIDAGKLQAEKLPAKDTPFGKSGDIFLTEHSGQSIYLLPRYGVGMNKVSPAAVPYRANIYAVKELGVQYILAWAPGGTVSHTFGVSDLVIPDDLIDMTHNRENTFFPDAPLGFLRQFPVFCPTLRGLTEKVLTNEKLRHRVHATVAVTEGPRLETPAEVRMLDTIGAEIVTHSFAPECFLAKELQLCYIAVCYIVNYAETGSVHRPFAAGELFGGLTHRSNAERLTDAVGAMIRVTAKVSAAIEDAEKKCQCEETMAANIYRHELSENWKEWFKQK